VVLAALAPEAISTASFAAGRQGSGAAARRLCCLIAVVCEALRFEQQGKAALQSTENPKDHHEDQETVF
jgi:hypothetical protein